MQDDRTMETDDETEERSSYSIIGRAGDDLTAQLRLVGWHVQQVRESCARADAVAKPLEEEVAKLQARLATIRKQQETDVSFHTSAIEVWVLDSNARETVGKTIPTAHGVIKTRQCKASTAIDEDLVLKLYQADPTRFDRCCYPALKVSKEVIRDRFELSADGRTVDRDTGEVLDEQVIRVVDWPRVKVTIETDEGEAQ